MAETLGTAGVVLEASTHNIGKRIIETLRIGFSSNDIVQCGDFYLRRSRILLRNNFELMNPGDQITAKIRILVIKKIRAKMAQGSGSNSRFYRLVKAMEYKHHSKETYDIVLGASRRALRLNLPALPRLSEALDERTDPRAEAAPENFHSTHCNLPTAFHTSLSAASDVFVGELDRVELEAYQSEGAGEGAVLLGLHRRDASTQKILATFSPTAPSNDSADTVDTMHTLGTLTESVIFGPPSVIESDSDE